VQRIAAFFDPLGREPVRRRAARWALAGCIGALPLLAMADGPAWLVPGGNAARGAQRIAQFGCAGCHTVPGVKNADGNVGPPLTRFADRTYIAGMLRNTPPNLVRWIREPQAVVPGNAMPNMGISEADARDIAAYLYTLR
jgi:cytochrome c